MINLLKNTSKAVTALITLYSIREKNMESERTIQNEEQQLQIKELIQDNLRKEVTNSSLLTKYEAISGRFKESHDEIKLLENKYTTLSDIFSKPGLSHQDKTRLISEMKYNLDRKMEVSKKITNEFNDITKDMSHNDIFGFVQEFMDNYKEYISNLNNEQLICLTNVLAFSIIISSLNSLIIAYYGNLIINHFNLELKYPKLANIIRIKSKISDKLIKFHILYIYVAAITMLLINLYMIYT